MDYDAALQNAYVILEQIPYGVGLFREGKADALFYNDNFYKLTGYTKEEYEKIVRTAPELFFFQEDRDSATQIFRRLTGGDTNGHFECRMMRKDGSSMWLRTDTSQFHLEGEELRLVSFTDDTAKKDAVTHLNIIGDNVDSSISIFHIVDGQ